MDRKRLRLAALVSLALGLALAGTAGAASYMIEGNGALPANLRSQVAAAGGTLVRVNPEIGIAVATSGNASFASQLGTGGNGIKSVTVDDLVQWTPGRDSMADGQVAAPSAFSSLAPTSAFFFACQWNLAQIDAPGAWAQGQLGAPGVKVAVLDTGTDPFHIDLAGKIDLANSASELTPGSSPCGSFDETTIFDLAFHGTFTSSLITTNGLGIAGVAPNANLVAVKVLNCAGSGSFGDVIAGILYAATLPDVDIINMSLGAVFPKNAKGGGPLVAALNRAVNFAQGHGKLVVSAAGNNAIDLDHDGNLVFVPAESGSGISIYATTIDDTLASYSNHGNSGTWVGAPGGDFPNTHAPLPGCPLNPALQSLVIGACSTFVCGGNNFYLVGDGTSFASPIAAGVAELVDAKHGGALGAGQLKSILAQSADDLGQTGNDNLFSHGRVNASSAVQH